MKILFTPPAPPRRTLLCLALTVPALFALAACATQARSANPPATIATPKPLPDDDAKFYAFIRNFRQDALAAGISPSVYDRSMDGIARNAHIQDLNNQQPEFVTQIWDYLDTAVSGLRVQNGRDKLAANMTMLANLESRYGVPKEILVAIWGAETNYGALTGHYNMFEALATLAYDGRRADYGRRQLIAALQMEQRENYDPKDMVSSWAGAFGHTQFVPTTFLTQAVDGDGDGKIDLWNSPADALASTASLLDKEGWQRGEPWFYEVQLPSNFPYAEAEVDNDQPLDHWRALGVKTALGAPLPPGPDAGAIFLPAGAEGPAFLVFHNFHTLLHYNNAEAYALSVGLLAQRIAGGAPVLHGWPRGEQPLSVDDRKALQRNLQTLGYDPGAIDGLLGKHARSALRAWQRAQGLVPDGFATQEILQRMERETATKGG